MAAGSKLNISRTVLDDCSGTASHCFLANSRADRVAKQAHACQVGVMAARCIEMQRLKAYLGIRVDVVLITHFWVTLGGHRRSCGKVRQTIDVSYMSV